MRPWKTSERDTYSYALAKERESRYSLGRFSSIHRRTSCKSISTFSKAGRAFSTDEDLKITVKAFTMDSVRFRSDNEDSLEKVNCLSIALTCRSSKAARRSPATCRAKEFTAFSSQWMFSCSQTHSKA